MAFSSSDISAIRAAERALAESFESPDPTAWVDFYTDDAVFVGPGAPAIEGRAALQEVAPLITISSMEIVVDSTIGTDGFAATLGRATWVNGPKGSGSPPVRRRLLMVWRREADGRWRIARELLNEDVSRAPRSTRGRAPLRESPAERRASSRRPPRGGFQKIPMSLAAFSAA